MQIKRVIQDLLKQLGIYERIKSSCLYELFWKTFNNQIIEQRDQEVEFYRRTLVGFKPGDLIFDVGANHGYNKLLSFSSLGPRSWQSIPTKQIRGFYGKRF
jgi:hypothetical protein